MLNAQPTQTVPAVPIAMKKAQQNVAGSMGSNPGAPGPLANPPKEASKLKKPKKKLHIKYIVGGLLLVLLLIGGGAGFYLTQVNQDVRQQAAEFADDAYSCVDGRRCPASYRCDRNTDSCVPIDGDGDSTRECGSPNGCCEVVGGCKVYSRGEAIQQ